MIRPTLTIYLVAVLLLATVTHAVKDTNLQIVNNGNVTLRGVVSLDNPNTYFYLRPGETFSKRDSHSDGHVDVAITLSRACPGKGVDGTAWQEVLTVHGHNPAIGKPYIWVYSKGTCLCYAHEHTYTSTPRFCATIFAV